MTHARPRGIAVEGIAAVLVGLFAFDNILLWAFLGKLTPLAAVAGGGLSVLLVALIVRAPATTRISVGTVVTCTAIAVVFLILGGEGRLLYANFDWQVRDAVLADMGTNAWPYAYTVDREAQVLRAPVGMYLRPALIGGASQTARDIALLASNGVMLGLLLALATPLFDAGMRRVALAVFIIFSGLDVVGTMIIAATGEYASVEHLERWMHARQYSSTITQIFWVPQHAFVGWAAAVLYLLWRTGRIGPATFVAIIPLAVLWSPLALLGVVPFAAFAGWRLLATRQVDRVVIGAALASVAIAAPAVVYILADSGQTAAGFQWDGVGRYLLFTVLEAGLYLMLVLRPRDGDKFDSVTFAITAGALLLIPLYHIGDGEDFMMRASIMPLAILSYFVARALTADGGMTGAKLALGATLMIGTVTGLKEVARVGAAGPSPAPACTLIEVWTRQGERIAPIGTYVARVTALPAFLRPVSPVVLPPAQPNKRCWSRDWATPR